jgi:adenylate cyclase class 2
MPFGDFLEIEGEKADIKNYASAMGQKWKKRILFNYLAIFDILKEKLDLPFSDVTFNNFKNVRFDLNKYTHLFEAGRE